MPYALRNCFELALKRLDLLLQREILRLRAAYQLSLDEFRGLYISDQQVDALVEEWSLDSNDGSDCTSLTAQAEALAAESRQRLREDPQWRHLMTEFELCDLELDVLFLALAPSLSLKYETLYAYLNNDITHPGSGRI